MHPEPEGCRTGSERQHIALIECIISRGKTLFVPGIIRIRNMVGNHG